MPSSKVTEDDVRNVEAWAEVLEDLLRLVPPEKRAEVLALASQNEDRDRKKREASGGFEVWTFTAADLKEFENSPGLQHWHAIMRLESLVIQVFVRHITNNHSPKNAAKILFAEHRYGTGSGRLLDYLEGLPGRTTAS